MRVLVLGGTAWLGREVARAATAAGHDVVCAARGTSGDPAEDVRLVQVDRDRDDGLEPLAGERWDAVVDVARQPGQVRRAVRDLTTAGHYVYVSSVSAHAEADRPGLDASAPLRQPLAGDVMTSMEPEVYGAAKVACEDAVRAGFAERSTLARVGLIGGPGDPSDRTTYWPTRFAAGGRALVPDVPDQPTSVVDVRDLAAWLVRCAEDRLSGAYVAAGPVLPLVEHLAAAHESAQESGAGAEAAVPVPTAPDWLTEHDVQPWGGPRSLPLWLPEEARWMTAWDASAAHESGLACRPLPETLADAARRRAEEPEAPWGAGLSAEEERDLLDLLG